MTWGAWGRFVLHLAEHRGFYFALYCAYFAATAALGLLSLAHWPGPSAMLLWAPQEDGYQVGIRFLHQLEAPLRSFPCAHLYKALLCCTACCASRLQIPS